MEKIPEELAREIKMGFDRTTNELSERVNDLEQKAARAEFGDGGYSGKSWGAQVADSDQVKALVETKGSQPGRVRIEVKDVSSGPTSGGALIAPMRDGSINMLAGRQPRLRDLLTVINTSSGSVEYVDQVTRDNNAAPVAEGTLKPQSDYAFELKNLPIRIIGAADEETPRP